MCVKVDEGRFGGLQDQEFSENRLRRGFFFSPPSLPHVILQQSSSNVIRNTMLSLCDANHAGICSIQADVNQSINPQILFQAKK